MKSLVPALNQFLASSLHISEPYTPLPLPIKFQIGISFSHLKLLNNCFFTTNDVELGLSMLKTSKSAGPDGMPGTFLFNIKSALCFSLWLIFRRSLDMETFPTLLTRSNSSFVVPFHSTNYGRKNPIHRMMRICNEHLGFS